MEQKTKNVSARITFMADKMLPKMKKCLEKKDLCAFRVNPAIELETGIMVVTNGHILSAHKLKDYRFDPSDGVVLGDVVMVPREVLDMKGNITVEVVIDGNGFPVVTAKEGRCDTATNSTDAATRPAAVLLQTSNYPKWRSVIPRTTGYPIDVDAKAWDAALKVIVPKLDSNAYPVRLYGEQKSKTLSIGWENYDEEQGSKEVSVGEMPYKVFVEFNGKRLRDVMAFGPVEMRFHDSTRAVLFLNDDTLVLLMPLLGNGCDLHCTVEKRYYDYFDLDRWIGADLGEVVVDNRESVRTDAKTVPTIEERLRAALRRQLRMAA